MRSPSSADAVGLAFSRLPLRRSLVFFFWSSVEAPCERGDFALGAGGGVGCMAAATLTGPVHCPRPDATPASMYVEMASRCRSCGDSVAVLFLHQDELLSLLLHRRHASHALLRRIHRRARLYVGLQGGCAAIGRGAEAKLRLAGARRRQGVIVKEVRGYGDAHAEHRTADNVVIVVVKVPVTQISTRLGINM